MSKCRDLEIEIAKKYERITGQAPLGLTDTLRILMGADMCGLVLKYMAAKKRERFLELGK